VPTITWHSDEPADSEAANTIHTIIQTAKYEFGVVMESEYFSDKQHNAVDSEDSGKHLAGQFSILTARSSDSGLATSFAYSSSFTGILGVNYTDKTLWYSNEDKEPVAISGLHGALTGLEDDDHPQYMLKDGTRAREEDLNGVSATFILTAPESTDDCPILDSHTSLSWYVAHGADSVASRHLQDSIVVQSKLHIIRESTYRITSVPSTIALPDGASNFCAFPMFQRSALYPTYDDRLRVLESNNYIYLPNTGTVIIGYISE